MSKQKVMLRSGYKKKIIAFITAIVLSFSSGTAMAEGIVSVPGKAGSADLGELDYWYSNTDIISRWTTQRKIYVDNLSSNSDFDLDYYVGYAIYQWSSKAGIACNVTGTDESNSIHIYGGLEKQLVDAGTFTDCSNINGRCKSTATVEGNYTYNGKIITGKVTTKSKIVIVEKSTPRTDIAYSKTTTHELGHSLGYAGHSLTKGDIMYTSSVYNTTDALTSQDVNHLKQVY